LKPDRDDPDAFLRFYSNGDVRPREGLSTAKERSATVTIRVLNLPATRHFRAMAVKSYMDGLLEILEAAEESERPALIQRQIEKSRNEPYCTAIRHFLEEIC